MTRRRGSIPRAVRDAVLKEFNHRCAVCGRDRPQVHHIDEDTANNDPLNLLPLCPNCHLTDHHNPTAPVDREKLALFRRFKDPTILTPEFEPLFARTRFLLHVEEANNLDAIQGSVIELAQFVAALTMGEFYAPRISQALPRPSEIVWISGTPEAEMRRRQAEYDEEYRKVLLASRDYVIGLVVELLRYQPWRLPSADPRRTSREGQ